MSTKQIVIEALQKLPEDADFVDISEKIAFMAAIEEGEQAFREGRVISDSEMQGRIEQWLSE
jgi:predicted transcriptional regulator